MTITLTPTTPDPAPAVWVPLVGDRTKAFVAKKTAGPRGISEPSMETVLDEATQILAHCTSPFVSSGSTAVLAVGYVQSGKTLSFTTVSALARDNGFGLVIVLAGTTNNLKGQSEQRLAADLGLEDLQRDWRHFDNPELTGSHFEDMRKTLTNWMRFRDGKTTESKPALLGLAKY